MKSFEKGNIETIALCDRGITNNNPDITIGDNNPGKVQWLDTYLECFGYSKLLIKYMASLAGSFFQSVLLNISGGIFS